MNFRSSMAAFVVKRRRGPVAGGGEGITTRMAASSLRRWRAGAVAALVVLDAELLVGRMGIVVGKAETHQERVDAEPLLKS